MAEKALVDKYAKPHHVNDVVLAFPGDLGDLLPLQELIPREFWSTPGPDGWCSWASEWFFRGLAKFPEARAGIDENEAIRHLSAILKSFQPSHEHKEAAVAWLASRWLVAEPSLLRSWHTKLAWQPPKRPAKEMNDDVAITSIPY